MYAQTPIFVATFKSVLSLEVDFWDNDHTVALKAFVTVLCVTVDASSYKIFTGQFFIDRIGKFIEFIWKSWLVFVISLL